MVILDVAYIAFAKMAHVCLNRNSQRLDDGGSEDTGFGLFLMNACVIYLVQGDRTGGNVIRKDLESGGLD